MKYFLAIITTIVFMQAASSFANPTQTGSTGLLTVPSADTMNAGEICVGVWGDISKTGEKHALIMPFSLTLGLGSFWEVYGSYPNIMFNGQEERSGKGTAELGSKFRFYGKRNSRFKLSADIFGQRVISENLANDGLTNVGSRIIASLTSDLVGMHLYGGYLFTEEPAGVSYKDEVLYGAGIELSPTSRSKLTFEITGKTNRDQNLENPMEGIVGLQYYLSPHITLNLAGGVGFSESSPEWRTIIGFSTCQGVGSYVKPVPKISKPGGKKEPEVVKPLKIYPITPLLMKAAVPAAPVSKLDVEVSGEQEEIYVRPYAQVVIPTQPSTSSAVMPPLESVISQEKMDKPVPAPQSLENPKEPLIAAAGDTEKEEKPGEGETPLYSIEVKGEVLGISTAETPSKPQKMKVYRKFRFPDVVFEYNQTEISADLKKSLSEVADLLRNDKQWSYIRIDAHTDSIGSVGYNMDLSLKRAITVASHLVIREGIDPGRVFIKGMGKTKMISDNVTTSGRKVNRRFEILLMTPAGK